MVSFLYNRKFYGIFAIFAGLVVSGCLLTRPAPAAPLLSVSAATAQGRAVTKLIGRKDAAGLFARFTSDMAQAVPLSSVRQLLEQMITSATPLGERLAEIVAYPDGSAPTYIAEHAWANGQDVMITATFDAEGKITTLLVKPAPTLPDRAAVQAVGRAVGLSIAKGDASAVFHRFTPEMAQAVPLSAIQGVLQQTITPTTPLGARQQEAVFSKDDTAEYIATYVNAQGRGEILTIDFADGSDRKIVSLLIRPAPRNNARTGAALPPDPRAGYRTKTALHLPFAPGDAWYVFWGGDTLEQNYHVIARDQRHAFDFVAMVNGSTHRGDGTECEQYYDWERKIVAPAAATVVEAIDGLPDNTPQTQTDSAQPAGNHVLLDFGDGEYALLAHMHKGSIRVKAGSRVSVGQTLGLCGNSGNTSEPHLHFHLQDKPYLFRDATGLPVVFHDYVSDGARKTAGSPVRGVTVVAGIKSAPTVSSAER